MRTFAKNLKATQQPTSPKTATANRSHFGQVREANSILDLQRTIGNQAIQHLLEANTRDVKGESDPTGIVRFGNNSLLTSAYKGRLDSSPTSSFLSARSEAQLTAGDQPDESGEVALGGDPVTSEADAQPQSGALGGDAASISTSNLSAAEWKNNGEFKWWIRWVTDGTSGWIVQKIENTYSGTRADGTAITNASLGVTPSYYEAWEVASNGTITGSLGATGNRDRWERPALGALGSPTNFSMKGTVYWTSRDPASSGFTSRGVANAGSLLSSTSAPAGIGSPLLVRNAYGTWASNGSPALPGCFTS